jgi:hypothetical protein
MGRECPRDGHGRLLDDRDQGLRCIEKGCECPECHKQLSEDEKREWLAR